MPGKNVRLTSPDGSAVDGDALPADFQAAEKIGPFRIGQLGFFYRDGLKIRAVPLADIDRAFTRIEPVPTHCCCGAMCLEIYRLVLCSRGREIADIRTEDETLVDKAQALLKARRPGIRLGYNPAP